MSPARGAAEPISGNELRPEAAATRAAEDRGYISKIKKIVELILVTSGNKVLPELRYREQPPREMELLPVSSRMTALTAAMNYGSELHLHDAYLNLLCDILTSKDPRRTRRKEEVEYLGCRIKTMFSKQVDFHWKQVESSQQALLLIRAFTR